MTSGRKHPYEVKVGACADYLIGKPIGYIEHKWEIKGSTVSFWIRKRKCFKLRKGRK